MLTHGIIVLNNRMIVLTSNVIVLTKNPETRKVGDVTKTLPYADGSVRCILDKGRAALSRMPPRTTIGP